MSADFVFGCLALTSQGLRQGWLSGLSLGSVQFVMYGTYAAGLFFGAYRVAAGDYTGGKVLQVLVATLMGGFSLGQAAPNLAYFAKGRAAGGRMFRVIDRVPAIREESLPASEKEPNVSSLYQNISLVSML